MNNVLQAVLVGAGFIGPAHLEALRRLNINVRGLVGTSPESARERAAALGIGHAYRSLEEALADPLAAVFHIAVPNDLHYWMVKKVLLAGKHVVCEKPLALNSQESKELLDLARKSGVVHGVSYNLRFYPMIREARDHLRSGKVGRVFLIHGSYLQDWLLHDTDWNWRLDPKVGGPLRAVADIGTHWIDMACHVTGLKVEAVLASLSTVHPVRQRPMAAIETYQSTLGTAVATEDVSITTEDVATMLFRFEGGALGSLVVSQVSAGQKNRLRLEVDGSQSSLSWDSEEPNRLDIGHRDKPNQVFLNDPQLLSQAAKGYSWYPGGHPEGFPDTFKGLFQQVYTAAAQAPNVRPEADYPTFEDGHTEMVVVDAILKSAALQTWVTLENFEAGEKI
jgi:predicted dehydrogenase